MLRRKHSYGFLMYSLMIHLLVLLFLSRLWYGRYQTPPVHDEVAVDITYLPRPKVLPTKRPKPPAPPRNSKPPEQGEKKTALKPTPAADEDWSVEHSFDSLGHRQAVSNNGHRSANSNLIAVSPHSGMPNAAYPKPQSIAVAVALQQPTNSGDVSALTGSENISMGESGPGLKANSPRVGPVEMHYWHKRGAVLGGMAVGNSYGGGTTVGPQGNYYKMMMNLAQDIAEAAAAYEVDVVFIVDKTGSMEDNVRGIRAYTDLFLEHLDRTGHNPAAGLVTFSDAADEKPIARGVTDNYGKFKTWLHKIEFEGGGDLLESGLDALMTGVREIEFRAGRQRFFVFASDAAFHDADYDGKSEYSLDQVIETLQHEGIRVNVLGLDYLPVKQIAWATQGVWRAIPGKGYLEYVPPITMTAKMLSEFGVLGFNENSIADELVVYVNRNPRPKWIKFSWKVLNPLGERCYGPFANQEAISNDETEVKTLSPTIDVNRIAKTAGTYTVIYHLENNLGHQSILRRTFDMPFE